MAKIKSQVPALPAPKKKPDEETLEAKKKKKKPDEETLEAKKKKKKRDAQLAAAALYEEEHPPKKKKNRDVLDVSAKKKKRTELTLSEEDEDDGPKLSLTRTKTLLKTQFGKGAEKILRLIDQDDTDPAVALLMKRLLSSVVDVLPYAEMGIRKTKGTRGTYQYVQLVSTLRELMVDIQSAQDRGMMGQTLVMSVVQPAFSDLAQDTVQEFSVLAADVKGILSEEDYARFLPLLKESRSRIANHMTRHYNVMKDGTVSFLQR